MSDSEHTSSVSGDLVSSLPYTVASIWAVLNHSTVFSWAYGVEGPFSQLAVWLAWTFVVLGAIELLAIAVILLIFVFGGLWILAGKTA